MSWIQDVINPMLAGARRAIAEAAQSGAPVAQNTLPRAVQSLANVQQIQPPVSGPYPGGKGNALPPGVRLGGEGWPDGVAHYNVAAPSDAVRNLMQCMTLQGPANFVVSSTSGGGHAKNSAHYDKLAFDALTNPADREAIMQAAENCGVVFQQDEYRYPSKDSSAGHLHEQLRPGLHNTTGRYKPPGR